MSKVFLLQNQQKFFINRQGLWVSGREPAGLFRVKNKDEAINEIFEISARDFDQRITVIEADATEKGVPIIDPEWISELPEPVYGEEKAEQSVPVVTTDETCAVSEPVVDADTPAIVAQTNDGQSDGQSSDIQVNDTQDAALQASVSSDLNPTKLDTTETESA